MNNPPIPKLGKTPKRASRGMARLSKHPGNIALRKKKKKAVTITKLKAQLWRLCRQIIIQRYGNTCYTCSAFPLVGSNLQLGHFITSSTCSTEIRYSFDNLRPQCFRCNISLSGNWVAFEQHLIRDGIDVEALKRRNQETKGLLYGRLWVTQKITEYESLLNGIS